jgi:hypothetical protein
VDPPLEVQPSGPMDSCQFSVADRLPVGVHKDRIASPNTDSYSVQLGCMAFPGRWGTLPSVALGAPTHIESMDPFVEKDRASSLAGPREHKGYPEQSGMVSSVLVELASTDIVNMGPTFVGRGGPLAEPCRVRDWLWTYLP